MSFTSSLSFLPLCTTIAQLSSPQQLHHPLAFNPDPPLSATTPLPPLEHQRPPHGEPRTKISALPRHRRISQNSSRCLVASKPRLRQAPPANHRTHAAVNTPALVVFRMATPQPRSHHEPNHHASPWSTPSHASVASPLKAFWPPLFVLHFRSYQRRVEEGVGV